MNQDHTKILSSKRKNEQHHTESTFESSISSPQSDNPNKRRLIDPSLNPASTPRAQQGSNKPQPSSALSPIRLGESPPHPKEPKCNVTSALAQVRESLDRLR